MSFFNGVKKNLNRAGQSIMQRTGTTDKTVDSEFEEEYARFKNLEKQTNKLGEEAKGYIKSVKAMTSAQVRIQETIEQFYSDSAPMSEGSIRYKEAVAKLNGEDLKRLDEAYQATVIDPIAHLCVLYPNIDEAVKRRQKKRLDYDTQRSKVRKLVDKPSEDPERLPRAEKEANMARELYENINTILITDLPKVVELRVPYLDPTFEALIKSELMFAQASYNELERLRGYFTPNDENVDNILEEMRTLTICGNF